VGIRVFSTAPVFKEGFQMTRHVFFSFHYDEDNWRTSQVRNMRDRNGDRISYDNDWESVRRGNEVVIQRWIKDQMHGCSCAAVLIGSDTANRKWINYEICEAWKQGMGVLGIYIHGLKDNSGSTSSKGKNPFDYIKFNGGSLSSVVPVYDPTVYGDSNATYANIANHMESLIEKAVCVRKTYP